MTTPRCVSLESSQHRLLSNSCPGVSLLGLSSRNHCWVLKETSGSRLDLRRSKSKLARVVLYFATKPNAFPDRGTRFVSLWVCFGITSPERPVAGSLCLLPAKSRTCAVDEISYGHCKSASVPLECCIRSSIIQTRNQMRAAPLKYYQRRDVCSVARGHTVQMVRFGRQPFHFWLEKLVACKFN